MSEQGDVQAGLDERRNQLDDARALLLFEVSSCCPGRHLATQHRDRKPPWCNSCGRDNKGRMLGKPTGSGGEAGGDE